jgi:hypothetical protein
VLYVAALVYVALLYLRPTEVFPGLAGVPTVLIASLLTAPVLGFAILNRPRRLLELPNDRYLIGLWVTIPVSCLAMGWFGGALQGLGHFGQIVFLYVLVRYAISTDRQFRGMVFLLISVVLVQALSGVVQWYSGVGLGGVTPLVNIDGTRRIRGVGIFNDPNDLAMALVSVVPLLVTLVAAASAALVQRAIAAAALLPILTAIYFTNSRGGVVALGASFIALAYHALGKWVATCIAVLGLVGIIALSQRDPG